jgi:ABC-type lipoprotein export system ATPase subunit
MDVHQPVFSSSGVSVRRGPHSCHILADEPTGNLDEDTAAEITAILKDSAHKSGKCVVIVTHSNELAKEADVVFRLRKGELQISDGSEIEKERKRK